MSSLAFFMVILLIADMAVCPKRLVCFIWSTCGHLVKRLQITITVGLRTHEISKNVYKKKLFSIHTVYYVYSMYREAYFFRICLDFISSLVERCF